MRSVTILSSFLDDAVRAEPVSIGSRCSGGVVLLPCRGKLMQQETALRETLNLNLTWTRNGEELIANPEIEVSQDPGMLCIAYAIVKSSWECIGVSDGARWNAAALPVALFTAGL